MTRRSWPVHVATSAPLSTGTMLWRLGGRPHLTVVLKAVFALAPDAEAGLEVPDPLSDADLVPYLPAAEVIVVGAGSDRVEGADRCRLLVAGEHPLVDKTAPPGGGPDLFAPEPAPERSLVAAEGADLPQGFDWTQLHAAPPDQRPPSLQGNEWIVLEGVVAGSPLIRTRLPDVGARAQILGLGAPVHVKLRLDTLAIDAAVGHVALVWRGFLALPREIASGELQASAALTLDGQTVETAPSAAPGDDSDVTMAFAAPARSAGPLPFSEQAPPPRPSAPGSAAPTPGAPWSSPAAPAPVAAAGLEGTLALAPAAASRALHDLEGTVAGGVVPAARALPFAPTAPRAASSPAIPVPGAPWAGPAANVPSPADFEGTFELSAATLRRETPQPSPPPPSAPRAAEPPSEPAPVAVAPVAPAPVQHPRVMEERPIAERRVEAPPAEDPAPPRPAPQRPATAPRKSATGALYTGFGPRKK